MDEPHKRGPTRRFCEAHVTSHAGDNLTTPLLWTIFDSDIERLDDTPSSLGEQRYGLTGAF